MSNVTVRGTNSDEKETPSIFTELGKRLGDVRRRAFELFEKRGSSAGNDLDDWLSAEHEVLGWPKAQLAEGKDAFEIQLTLPGFEARDIEVTTKPGEIAVHAAAVNEKQIEEGQVLWTEFGSSEFYRKFELPRTADFEKVTARLDKGILRIKAPKGAVAPEKTTKAAA
jgi:HSP20 family protein